MVTRLEIAPLAHLVDPLGELVTHKTERFLGIPLEETRTCEIYQIAATLDGEEPRRVLDEFVDPIQQRGALGRLDQGEFDFVVNVAFKPGVTDAVGKSARVAIEDTLGRALEADASVYCSRAYFLRGVDRKAAERIATELLANPVIETILVEDAASWRSSEPSGEIPRVAPRPTPEARPIDLDGPDEELERISREGLLALTLPEMRAIRDHFRERGDDESRRGRGLDHRPTDAELECLAQTWSEHCKHKIFNATILYRDETEPGREPERIGSLFDEYIKRTTRRIEERWSADGRESWLVSVFHDNAGVVRFDEKRHLVFKVETHNSPSALDPYGGAITGIVGVNRDPFGTGIGSDLLCNVWGYCFASPFHEGPIPQGLMHPRRIRDGVHQGVIDGGNQSGIPYARGWELFDERFLGKPLVFCGTVGSLPVEVAGRPGEEKRARPGDRIVMVGGRIGADGIHGATFSSAALDESSPVQAVQIGDPITQKQMFDFLLEARDAGLYSAITDNGAGGLSSSVGEMAEGSGGAELDLSLAPVKYQGLAPWEILISEAQERMTLAVPPEKVDRFLALAARRDVEASVLGNFDDSGEFHVRYGDRTVARLSMEFLHEGLPEMKLEARWSPPSFEEPAEPEDDLVEVWCSMLGRLNLCSRENTVRHYDHEVKGLSVVKPLIGIDRDIPAEATVMLAGHDSLRGLVLAEAVNPYYSDIDTYWMAQSVVDEAVRRLLCAGAQIDRIAILDNFCWPDPVASRSTPDGAYKLAQLVRACRGLYDAATAYETPLISGKDSMKNDAHLGGVKISIPPTLLISALGQIENVRDAITLSAKRPGDVIFLLGTTRNETGASEYHRYLGDRIGLGVPKLRTGETLPLYAAFHAACRSGLVRSAATPSLGGLGLCLARVALAGGLGLDLDWSAAAELRELSPATGLFSESTGRFVVTTAATDADRFEKMFEEAGSPCRRVGQVVEDPCIAIRGWDAPGLEISLDEMRRHYEATLRDA